MVNQDVYSVYAHHHKEKLMQEAQVSRFLTNRQTYSQKSNRNPGSIFSWLLKRINPESNWDKNKVRSAVEGKSSLRVG